MNTNPTPEAPETRLLWVKPDGSSQEGPKDEIMASYWRAGQVGKLIPVAVAVATTVATTAVSAPVRAAPVSQGFGALTVDAEKGAIIEARIAQIRAAGFAVSNTAFASGTRMLQSGVDEYHAIYREWGQRPPAEDAMREVAQKVREENRTDLTVRLGDLRMAADGTMGRKGRPSSPIEWGAWGRIYGALRADGVFPDGFSLLAALDPATRAGVFNERIQKIDPDREVNIGLRRNSASGGWSIFRVVSTRYPLDGQADIVLDGMADRIEGLDWRGSVVYDTATTNITFDAAHMASPTALDPTVGDVFRAGIKGSTNDTGNGRFWLVPFVGRIVCINCTVADGYAPGYTKVHKGSMTDALNATQGVVASAKKILPIFAADWKVARNTPVESFNWTRTGIKAKAASKIHSVSDALEALVIAGEIGTGTARDALVHHLLNAHKAEPGETLADVLNAVTRASHEALLNDIQRDVLERQAGKLLPMFAQRSL